MRVSVIGVYPVLEAEEPCHLLELDVLAEGELFDFTAVTQEQAGQPQTDWQVPYDEHVLDPGGSSGRRLDPLKPLRPVGAIRVAFFFHYLEVNVPLVTPGGKVRLPPCSERPSRLDFMTYVPPG